jgi:uncharacterized protein DUF742
MAGAHRHREWADDGPLVRDYMITAGRTRGTPITPTAMVAAVPADPAGPPMVVGLNPEHLSVLGLCPRPVALAEIAARLGLPLSMVRVLLDDLSNRRLVTITSPDHDERPHASILREALTGLRAL